MNTSSTPNLTDNPYTALISPPSAMRPMGYRLAFALHAAVVAPSVHNTQPWSFSLHQGHDPYVDLLMDRGRGLPVLDPAHRQLVISCGAALAAYEIGLRACGLAPHIELFPPRGEAACLARIHVSALRAADPRARQLLRALLQRRSYRGPMTDQPIAPPLLASLEQAAAPFALLHLVPTAAWLAVEHIITDATLELAENTTANEELRTWTPDRERSHDGVPATNWQRTSEQTVGAPVVQRDFAQGRPLPAGAAATAVEANPLLAVLLTPADTPAEWLNTGRALLAVAVTAQAGGLALGYLNQPTEVPGLRERLATALKPLPSGVTTPQLVLRLGHPAQPLPPAAPRRTVHTVLLQR